MIYQSSKENYYLIKNFVISLVNMFFRYKYRDKDFFEEVKFEEVYYYKIIVLSYVKQGCLNEVCDVN